MESDLEEELARRDALALAAELVDVPPRMQVRVGALLLARWARDAEIRTLLRPLFVDAVPDQRALLALGDVDVWLRDGRIARGWWERAAAGPDPELAALGAWRSGRALARGGWDDLAAPWLAQAAAAGHGPARLALGRILAAHEDGEAAVPLLRRAGGDESVLLLAEIRLRADDVDGAEEELYDLARGPRSTTEPDFRAWEDGVLGEIAFRRGDLEEAENRLEDARQAPGLRWQHYHLRLAQIAIVRGDATEAYRRTAHLVGLPGVVGDQVRLLLRLHRDLIAEGDARCAEAGAADEPDGDDCDDDD